MHNLFESDYSSGLERENNIFLRPLDSIGQQCWGED